MPKKCVSLPTAVLAALILVAWTSGARAQIPTIHVSSPTVTEGNTGTSNCVFVVTLSAPDASTITVDYSTADNTASAGTDYSSASGTLSFPPGTTELPVSVQVNGDIVSEKNESFFLILSNPVNAALAGSLALGSIIEDDAQPNIPDITIDDPPAVVEGGTITFTVSLSSSSVQPVQVSFVTTDGTAKVAADYAAAAGVLTFYPGETSKSVFVNTNDDSEAEAGPAEVFFVNLVNPVNGTIADVQGSGQVTDNEGSVSVDGQPPIDDTRILRVEGPAGGLVTVHYQLRATTDVLLEVFDVGGRRIRVLEDRLVDLGEHAIAWDQRDLSGNRVAHGTYFVRLKAGNREDSVKSVLWKE